MTQDINISENTGVPENIKDGTEEKQAFSLKTTYKNPSCMSPESFCLRLFDKASSGFVSKLTDPVQSDEIKRAVENARRSEYNSVFSDFSEYIGDIAVACQDFCNEVETETDLSKVISHYKYLLNQVIGVRKVSVNAVGIPYNSCYMEFDPSQSIVTDNPELIGKVAEQYDSEYYVIPKYQLCVRKIFVRLYKGGECTC